jgi:glycosyltransferase involved in cell wall biosynthesis
MRIAHLAWSLRTGGLETMLVDIVAEQSLSAEVFVVVINREYDESVMMSLSERVGIVRIERPASSRNPWYSVRLHRVLRRLKPDILHSHGRHIVEMLPFRSVPIVATMHDTRIRLSSSVRRHEKVFVISEAVKEDLLARYPGLDLTVIHNGIDFSQIRQKERYGACPFRIVQVGSLNHPKKGQDVTLWALRYVNDKLGDGSLTADFIGEGESRQFLEGLAAELGVSQWCRFLGLLSRQQTYDLLPGYDLLVQPSRYEGFGLTVVEGMAANLPVLVSDIEGPMEVIDKGRHGFFFRSEDFKDCGDRIIDIMQLSRTPDFPARINESYEYAKNRFDIRLTARNYLDEYEKTLSLWRQTHR